MNVVIIKGRLTKDIELKEFDKDGKTTYCANFSIAIQRDKNKGCDFIPCLAWGKTAENLKKYCVKGQEISCMGSWKTGSYAKNGGTIYTHTCEISRFEFCGKKEEAEEEEEIPFN